MDKAKVAKWLNILIIVFSVILVILLCITRIAVPWWGALAYILAIIVSRLEVIALRE